MPSQSNSGAILRSHTPSNNTNIFLCVVSRRLSIAASDIRDAVHNGEGGEWRRIFARLDSTDKNDSGLGYMLHSGAGDLDVQSLPVYDG